MTATQFRTCRAQPLARSFVAPKGVLLVYARANDGEFIKTRLSTNIKTLNAWILTSVSPYVIQNNALFYSIKPLTIFTFKCSVAFDDLFFSTACIAIFMRHFHLSQFYHSRTRGWLNASRSRQLCQQERSVSCLFVDSARINGPISTKKQRISCAIVGRDGGWFLDEQELYLRYICCFMFTVRTPNKRIHEICYMKY